MSELPPNYIPRTDGLSFLYVDGGVIMRNPSKVGGAWAIRIIEEKTIHDAAGIVKPSDFSYRGIRICEAITNNIAEMVALVEGLRRLPKDWVGVVCSDSEITIGRAIHSWKWKNIPPDLFQEFGYERNRLVNWEKFRFIGLSGHPTKDDLIAGFRADTGRPVSPHNVWCDETCKQMSYNYLHGGETRLEDIYDRTSETGFGVGWNKRLAAISETPSHADAD